MFTGADMNADQSISVRIGTQLSIILKNMLHRKYHVELVGSWASGEAHLPQEMGSFIHSLSDVDIISERPIDARSTEEISNDVKQTALRYGVLLSKVSIRYKAEVDHFWSPFKYTISKKNPYVAGKYLYFWAIVGAIEMISIAHSLEFSRNQYYSYAVVKFFFKVFRNIILVDRCAPVSYFDITKIVYNNHINHQAVIRAYLIKLGRIESLSAAECRALFCLHSWDAVTRNLVDEDSTKRLFSLLHDIIQWFETGYVGNMHRYLYQLELMADSSDLWPAYLKAVSDYDKKYINVK